LSFSEQQRTIKKKNACTRTCSACSWAGYYVLGSTYGELWKYCSREQRKLRTALDGVPGSIISSAIIPSSPEESDKMASIIEEQKKGYARTRYGTEEDTAGASAEIDDMDIEMSLSPSLTVVISNWSMYCKP